MWIGGEHPFEQTIDSGAVVKKRSGERFFAALGGGYSKGPISELGISLRRGVNVSTVVKIQQRLVPRAIPGTAPQIAKRNIGKFIELSARLSDLRRSWQHGRSMMMSYSVLTGRMGRPSLSVKRMTMEIWSLGTLFESAVFSSMEKRGLSIPD